MPLQQSRSALNQQSRAPKATVKRDIIPKPPRKARFLFSKSSISLLDCWFVCCFFTEIALENRAFGPVSRPETPAFHRRNRAFGPVPRSEKPAFHRRNRAFGPVSRPEKPAFHRRNRAFGPISMSEKPAFHRRNRAETGPKIDPQNHRVWGE